MSIAADPARLLGAVADALNKLEAAGIAVEVDHGAVLTTYGYVLPNGDSRLGMRWATRTRTDPASVRHEIAEGPGASGPEIRQN